MFRHFHAYHPEVWDAQVKNGLVNEGDGIRFCQSIAIKDYLKFNNLACRDGELYRLITEHKLPFYIDRLQGGTYFEGYNYDFGLLDSYLAQIGEENFYGFQFHEWASNYRYDLEKLRELDEGNWNEKAITDEINRKYKMPYLFLESMSAKEMAHFGNPKTAEEYYAIITSLFEKRMLQSRGLLHPVDSYSLAYGLEIEGGAKIICAEIGAQTPFTRLQVCYARGMAKAHKIRFGTYYEPWGGIPFSTCSYHREGKNEWGIGESVDFPFEAKGENGGSSRSLQERMYIYSYMNNADFLAEEWGLCNNFYDWNDFELSPYGKVNKAFADFRKKFSDVGEKLCPVAVILNEKHKVIDNINNAESFCGYELFGQQKQSMKTVKNGLGSIFCQSTQMLGNERNASLFNSHIPDAIDLLNYGNVELSKYKYLIDLTCSSQLSDDYSNLIAASDIETVLKKELPCYVEGGLLWMVNQRTTGGYYLTVFNNSGVSKTVENGETIDKAADRTVTLTIKGEKVPTVCHGTGKLSCIDDSYRLTVVAGGYCILKF